MDVPTIIGFSIIVGIIAITIGITMGLDRLRRRKLGQRFRLLEPLLDPGSAALGTGPEIKGSFHGRQLHGFRRTEYRGFTARAGVNGKAVFDLSCSTPLQFTAFTFPQWTAMAELLQVGSERVPSGFPNIDRMYGFASPDPDRFRAWVAQPENQKALLVVLSQFPPSRKQRFRVRVEGMVELTMPEYLYFRMQPAQVKLLFDGLDNFAVRLEQCAG
jgi:hypothetical protein